MNQKFNNYVSSLQGEQCVWPAYYIEQDRNYLGILPNSKKAKILEFGPGKGYFTDWLVCNGYENITLVELDENNCKFLSHKYRNFENIKVIYGDMVSYLKDCSQTFSVIISKQVIEHIPVADVADVFENGKNLLSEDGVVVHETINAANIIYGNYYRYNDFSHTISYTEKSLKEFSNLNATVRNYYQGSLFGLVKSHVSKKESKIISKFSEKLQVNNTINKNHATNDSSNLFISFIFQFKLRIKWTLSRLLTRLFLGHLTKVSTHFLIVELRKESN